MKLLVLKPIRLKKQGRLSDSKPGDTVEIKNPEKAKPLINGGYLKSLPPPDSSGPPQAMRIWSSVVGEPIWLILSPDGIQYVQEGEAAYTREEIHHLRDATPEEVRVTHMVKKELGGHFVMVKEAGNS